MENWFRDVGRPALLEALQDTCDRINNSFKTDFREYAQSNLLSLTTELETLRQEASQASRLKDENARLKNEIKALKETIHERNHAPNIDSHREVKSTIRTPLAPKSINQLSSKPYDKIDIESLNLSELRSEFLRVDKKYAKLYDKYLNLRDALSKSSDLVRERTTMYQQWVDHAKQLGEQSQKRAQRIKKLEAKLAEMCHEPLNLSFSSDVWGVEMAAESASSTPIPPNQCEQFDIATPTLVPVPQNRPGASARIDDAGRPKSPLKSRSVPEVSQSDLDLGTPDLPKTNGIAPCLPPLPQNREPVVGGQHIKSEPSSDTPVVVSERCIRKRKYHGGDEKDVPTSIKLKIEHSPEPQSTDEAQDFTPPDSIDFDTGSRRVETPRKHTRYQRAYDAHLDEGVNVQEQEYNARTMHLDKSIKHNRPKSRSDVSTIDLEAANYTELHDNTGSALQSHNHNRAPHPRSNLALGTKSQNPSAMPRGLASIAEDDYPDGSVSSSNSKNGDRLDVLERLLNTPSPAQDYPARDGQSTDFVFQLPKRRELPFEKDGRRRVRLDANGKPNVLSHGTASPLINQDHERQKVMNKTDKGRTGAPLRQIPKARLRLDDFKINPNVNEGYDYAFSDVVRNKDDRACLQGCIKDNCCGRKFRALARASRVGTGPYEFQSLLESYLGNDRYRLSTMSEAEKETLWIEAKTRELANTSGKHRHRYPRMSTPPGFWRADFPSTQEGEEYKEEAAKLELELIEERYREAMRPGGLWVFRDE
ncbi:DNA repair protein endonuclease SAE2/CtIP C-terminus-domain-containing protein [Xylaria digitata]|nr:DNA repair protein endonuclease SAE2/CtIP C-terminus-domain-containing protein [Xylaria digitata]